MPSRRRGPASRSGHLARGPRAPARQHSLPEMKRILDDNGIRHLELEFLTDWFVDGEKRKASDVTRRMLLESAAVLGARHIKVGDFFKTPRPHAEAGREFAQLCGEARDHGTRDRVRVDAVLARSRPSPTRSTLSHRRRAAERRHLRRPVACGQARHPVRGAWRRFPKRLPDVHRDQRRLSQGAARAWTW